MSPDTPTLPNPGPKPLAGDGTERFGVKGPHFGSVPSPGQLVGASQQKEPLAQGQSRAVARQTPQCFARHRSPGEPRCGSGAGGGAVSERAERGGPGAREGRAARAKRRMERQGKLSSLTAEQAPAEPSDIETICEGFGIRERAGQASAGTWGCSPSRCEAARLLAGPSQSLGPCHGHRKNPPKFPSRLGKAASHSGPSPPRAGGAEVARPRSL